MSTENDQQEPEPDMGLSVEYVGGPQDGEKFTAQPDGTWKSNVRPGRFMQTFVPIPG